MARILQFLRRNGSTRRLSARQKLGLGAAFGAAAALPIGVLVFAGSPPAPQPTNQSSAAQEDKPATKAKLDLENTMQSTAPASSMDSSNRARSSTRVEVNGQDIPVPANGSIHKTIPTAGGQTEVDVSVRQQSSSIDVQSNSSSSIRIESDTSSSSSVDQDTDIDVHTDP